MTLEEIIEANKLITEFMGATITQGDNSTCKISFSRENAPPQLSQYWCYSSSMQYHSSWDWLMPVVEKIESLKSPNRFNFEIVSGSHCFIYKDGYEFIEGDSDTKIQAVYEAIIEFIKWHNQ